MSYLFVPPRDDTYYHSLSVIRSKKTKWKRETIRMKGYSEISLTENVDNQTFDELSSRIESEFNGHIKNDLTDLESKYRDFDIGGKRITLHKNTFAGVSIFSTKLEKAESDENILVESIGYKLKYTKSNTTTWTKFRTTGEYEINYLLENIHYCRSEKGNYEISTYEEYNGGCDDHDHCEVCSTVISCKLPDRELYSSPRNIVCVECYKDFIKEDDYLDKIETYEKFERLIRGKANNKKWLNQIKNVLTNKKKKTDNKR